MEVKKDDLRTPLWLSPGPEPSRAVEKWKLRMTDREGSRAHRQATRQAGNQAGRQLGVAERKFGMGNFPGKAHRKR